MKRLLTAIAAVAAVTVLLAGAPAFARPPTLPVGPLVPAASGTVAVAAGSVDRFSRDAVIEAYRSWFAPTLTVATGWTGNVGSCTAGTISAENATATLSAVNYVRAQAGLPAVLWNEEMARLAQAAALIMSANGSLTHTPPSTAACWTADGYAGASHSNLSTGTGPRAVASYMIDSGANLPVGHRRWLLYQKLWAVGSGDASTSNALYVLGPQLVTGTTQWVSWPTDGYFPAELEPYGRWSLSYPGADFSTATVAVTAPDGQVIVAPPVVHDGYGDPTIAWDMVLPRTDGFGHLRSGPDYPVTITVSGIVIDGKGVDHAYTSTLVTADPTPTGPTLRPLTARQQCLARDQTVWKWSAKKKRCIRR